MANEFLENKAESNVVWVGLGGNFDSLPQIINELVDNSLSDLIRHHKGIHMKSIFIKIIKDKEKDKDKGKDEEDEENYHIQIEDTGSGIENLSAAFSLGNYDGQETSLNEHGFGMKNALAAANNTNDAWKVITRNTKAKDGDYYYVVEAPYSLSKQRVTKVEHEKYPGELDQGTIVSFDVSFRLIKTIVKGLKGNYQKLSAIVGVLSEDLGYTYGPLLKKYGINMEIIYKDDDMDEDATSLVSEVVPKVQRILAPGIGDYKHDFGRGELTLHYEFLCVERNEKLYKHYLANMDTSGVEIRVNGRLLTDNLFTEIWGIEKHNAYNYLLVKLDVRSDNVDSLPKTKTTKTGFLQDDKVLSNIYSWVSKELSPSKRAGLADHEVELFEQLRELKEKMYKDDDSSCVVETERYAFTRLDEKIRIDLYQMFNDKITIYEGKKDKTTPKDVYQLLMYWDGLTFDGNHVNQAILIASEHPDSVKRIVEYKNGSKDSEGNQYNIKLDSWHDVGINYPEN